MNVWFLKSSPSNSELTDHTLQNPYLFHTLPTIGEDAEGRRWDLPMVFSDQINTVVIKVPQRYF